MKSTDILTCTQVAEILGVNDRRVRALIGAGKLPAKQYGRAWLIKRSDIDKVKDRKPGRPWPKKTAPRSGFMGLE